MNIELKPQAVVIGGGIAGLWTLHKLLNTGINAILLEKNTLGGMQTVKSQGIIHGGLKYALNGLLNKDVKAIQDMPKVWRDCILNKGEIDLSSVTPLSECQYLFSDGNIKTKALSFFASLGLQGKVSKVAPNSIPKALTAIPNCTAYKLDEIVLDLPNVLQALVQPVANKIIHAPDITINHTKDTITDISFTNSNQNVTVKADNYIFTAGEANKNLTENLPDMPQMQVRPLHMVIVKSKNLPKLYGHCMGDTDAPRLTITTHFDKANTPVWYLGGKIAELGVNKSKSEIIEYAKSELKVLFPQIDLTDAKFTSFFVNRAEYLQANGKKPETITVFKNKNTITAWPTKLALAPKLASRILEMITITQDKSEINYSEFNLKTPAITLAPWDEF